MPVAIYNAIPGEDAATVCRMLEAAGIRSVILSDPNPSPFLALSSGGNYRVQIGVDTKDAAAASAILAKYDQSKERRTRRFNLSLATAGLLGLTLLTVFIVATIAISTNAGHFAMMTFLVAVSALITGSFVYGVIREMRNKRRR